MPSGLLLKFNASHHALVTLLVLEATLVKHLRRCYLWKCNGKVPKLFFYVPWIWSILAQISAIEGAAHGLQPCNSNERTHIRAGWKSRDWCTVKFFDLQSSGVFGRNHCSSEASMSLDLAALWFQSPAFESVVMLILLVPISRLSVTVAELQPGDSSTID